MSRENKLNVKINKLNLLKRGRGIGGDPRSIVGGRTFVATTSGTSPVVNGQKRTGILRARGNREVCVYIHRYMRRPYIYWMTWFVFANGVPRSLTPTKTHIFRSFGRFSLLVTLWMRKRLNCLAIDKGACVIFCKFQQRQAKLEISPSFRLPGRTRFLGQTRARKNKERRVGKRCTGLRLRSTILRQNIRWAVSATQITRIIRLNCGILLFKGLRAQAPVSELTRLNDSVLKISRRKCYF